MSDTHDEMMKNTNPQAPTENPFFAPASPDLGASEPAQPSVEPPVSQETAPLPLIPSEPVSAPTPASEEVIPVQPTFATEVPQEAPATIPPFLPPVLPPKPKKKKSRAKFWIILSLVGVLLIAAVLAWFLYFDDLMAYNSAKDLMDAKKYDQAITAFAELGDFKDSKDMIKECKYKKANALLGKGEFEQALEQFEALGNYKNVKSKIWECKYGIASRLMEMGEYEQAYDILKALNGYKDSAVLMKKFVWRLNEEQTPDETIHYTYDVNGNILKKIYADYEINYIYDADNHLIKEEYTGDNSKTIEYTYDEKGNVLTEKRLSGSGDTYTLIKYTYDNKVLKKKIRVNEKDILLGTTEYVYNSKGSLAREIYTNASEEKQYTEYTYNEKNQLTEKKVIFPNDSEEITTYTYKDEQLVKESTGSKTTEYTYDEHGNQTQKTITDSDGNKRTTKYTYTFIMLQ